MTMAGQAQTAYYAQPNGAQAPPQRRKQGPVLLVHGWQKAGKSSLGDSGPRPVLTLDVETAAMFTPSRKVFWNPVREPVPVADGSWDTCVVLVHEFATLDATLQVMNRGQHPFNSVNVDSVPSIQQRVMMAAAGYGKMERDDWGKLLRQTTGIIWGFKDLVTHPTRQVWAVTFVCQTHFDHRQGKFRPFLMGQSADYVPYIPDLEGWVYIAPDGSRRMWCGPSDQYETGNRLWGRLPDDMQLGYPGMVEGWTVETMAQRVLETQ
jgi:hypothetical protein